MPKCPKCGAKLITDADGRLFCPAGCLFGIDSSENEIFEEDQPEYEIYDNENVDDDETEEIDDVICPKCGSDKTAYDVDNALNICSDCGCRFKLKSKAGKKLKNKTIAEKDDDEENEGYWLGFLLSFILGIIGLIIAYLVGDNKKGAKRGAVHGIITELVLGAIGGIIYGISMGAMLSQV